MPNTPIDGEIARLDWLPPATETTTCFYHSDARGLVRCLHPKSGEQHCHQCGRPLRWGKVSPFPIESVYYCGNGCADAWLAQHPNYWDAGVA